MAKERGKHMKRKSLVRMLSLILAVNMTVGMIPALVMADETDASSDEDPVVEIIDDEEETTDEIAGDEDAVDAEVIGEANDIDETVAETPDEDATADDEDVADIEEPEDIAVDAEEAEIVDPADEETAEEAVSAEDDVAPAEEDIAPTEDVEEVEAVDAEEALETEEEVVSVEADDVETFTINETTVPDPTLRTILSSLAGSDKKLTQTEMNAVTEFIHPGSGATTIGDITGLDKCYFPNVTEVNLSNNSFTGTIDFSVFPNVEKITMQKTPVSGIKITNCNKIRELDLKGDRNVSSRVQGKLDFSDKPSLEFLDLRYNAVTWLDLSGCVNLAKASLDENPLQYLNISETLLGEVEVKSGNFETLIARDCPLLGKSIIQPDGKVKEVKGIVINGAHLKTIDVTGSINIEKMTLSNNRLASITGLDTVLGLRELVIDGNQFATIDLTKNTNLKVLNISDNPNLTKLDVSKNGALETLNFSDTQVSSVVLTKCTSLTTLECSSAKLAALDVTKNTVLETLVCSDNSISNLDLSKNTVLIKVECQDNKLTSIAVANMDNLTALNCSNNYLTSLKATNCEHLTSLIYSGNDNLKVVNLQGCVALQSFKPSTKMTKLTSVNLSGCRSITTISVPNNTALTTLNVSGCINVTSLDCSNCKLTSLDVSEMTALKTLKCGKNQITALKLTNCTVLSLLECYENKIGKLDLSKCTKLQTLKCNNNNLTSINLNGCDEITSIICNNNTGLSSLSVSGKQKLKTINVNSTGLTSLNASGLEALESLQVQSCPNLKTINVSGDVALTKFSISDASKLSSIDVSGCKALKTFTVRDLTALTTLKADNCIKLTSLTCSGNALTTLTLAGCSALEKLDCSDNKITKINLSDCESLETLNCSLNKLKTLNLNACTLLDQVNCSKNILESLSVNKCTALKTLNCEFNKLETLNISKCKKLTSLNCNHNLFTLDPTDIEDLEAAGITTSGNEIKSLKYLEQDIPLLQANANGANKIKLSWNKVFESGTYEAPDAYIVYMSKTKNGTYEKIFDANGTSFTANNLQPNTTYYFYVRAAFGSSSYSLKSPIVSATTTDGTAPVTPTPSHGSQNGTHSNTDTGVEGFVERLYTVALGRESDPYGKADWVNRVRVEGATGADLARGFLFSDEFLKKNMSNSQFLDVLYETFFNRPADEHKADWLALMDKGWSKTQVIDGFINSTEWANLCLTFGIASGTSAKPNITVTPSQGVIDFATRLYTTCLGRKADQAGLDDWSTQLANMQISGSDAAHGFFFSGEFQAAGYSDSEYVTRLYRTFMGREPDQGGFDNWMHALASGKTREDVFQGFAGSAEWAGICADYGILK